MLQAIRDRVTGWVAWIVIGLIGVTFALWGIDWYLKRDAQIFAARVNGVKLPVNEFRRAYQMRRDQIRISQGENFNPDSINEAALKKQVLDQLVEEELLVQAAADAGFAVSDALLAARIHAVAEFQLDGKFSVDRYQSILARQGMSPAQFEHRMRRSLMISQLVSGVTNTVPVPRSTIDNSIRLFDQSRDLRYVKVPVQKYMGDVETSDEQLRSYYESNRDKFVEPETVKLAYLELQLDDISKGIAVEEDALVDFYEQQKHRLGKGEERRARHILLNVAEDAPDEEVEAVLARANDLIARIKAGGSFADLAKEYSDDAGSASQGGDLGFFGKGVMGKSFEDVAFELDAGEVSEPVRSPFGVHIIEVTEIRAAETPPLEEVRGQLSAELVKEEAKNLFFDHMEELAQATFESPDTLAPAAEALQLTIGHSDWIPRDGGGGIGKYPQVIEAAFSDDVLESGNNSEVIEVEPNHVLVIRVEEHRPSRQKEFSEVEAEIRAALLIRNAARAVREVGEKLTGELRSGAATLEELAAANGLEVKNAGFVTRSATDHPSQVVSEAFRLPVPAEGRSSVSGIALASDDYVVIEVTGVKEGDPAQIPPDRRESFKQDLQKLYGQSEAGALVADLKSRAEIETNPDDL
jgi:peptidyl-prolyl cis-trans isomerase D